MRSVAVLHLMSLLILLSLMSVPESTRRDSRIDRQGRKLGGELSCWQPPKNTVVTDRRLRRLSPLPLVGDVVMERVVNHYFDSNASLLWWYVHYGDFKHRMKWGSRLPSSGD